MKKKARKLTLHRETVRSLSEPSLGQVAGGSWACSGHTFCVTDCPWCPTDTYTQPTEYTVCNC